MSENDPIIPVTVPSNPSSGASVITMSKIGMPRRKRFNSLFLRVQQCASERFSPVCQRVAQRAHDVEPRLLAGADASLVSPRPTAEKNFTIACGSRLALLADQEDDAFEK